MKETRILVLLGVVAVVSATKCWKESDDRIRRPAIKASDSKFSSMKLAAIPPPDPILGPQTLDLELNVEEPKDKHLIEQRKYGINLDWSFIAINKKTKEAKKVLAHKSLLLKYSNPLRCVAEKHDYSGVPFNELTLFYSARAVEAIMTLLYEHKVTINVGDAKEVFAIAKALKIDEIILVSSAVGHDCSTSVELTSIKIFE